jgi:hypothetical protein
MSHAPDCALELYASHDPATLRTPLVCDCDQDDGPDEPLERAVAQVALQGTRPRGAGAGQVVLTGAAAEAYEAFRAACSALKAAQEHHIAALARFTEAL